MKRYCKKNNRQCHLRKWLKLCLVTCIDNKPIDEYLQFIGEAVKGGVSMVQLREKVGHIDLIRERALIIRDYLKPFGVPYIINDYVELAKEIDADGVHIGQKDISVKDARKVLGDGKIIGLTIENYDQLCMANATDQVNYIGVGAIYPTDNKKDYSKLIGLKELERVVKDSIHPVTAIGGITKDNISDVYETGVDGISVIGAIHNAIDAYEAARVLINRMNCVQIR